MTKQTLDRHLHASSSSMSLRLPAILGPMASSPATDTDQQTARLPTREYLLADMAGRSRQENPVCTPCFLTLRSVDQPHVRLGSPAECRLCAVSAGKPEAYTKPFCDFLTENPTIFHTVAHFKTKLADAGFHELPARANWAGKLEPGGKYWTTRNGSALIAFTVGQKYEPGNGVAMIAGHIDALTARLKPVSTKRNAAGYVQLGVAPYAGGLNATWWDRDLSIGGRVVVRDPDTGKTSTRLVKLGWPIARIPTLAPHFGVGMMGQNNPETQAVPIIGLDNSDLGGADTSEAPAGPPGSFAATQPPKLVKLIARELRTSASAILNWDLELYDSQPAQTGGLDREFIFAGRVDDKLCSWAA
ncbi:hypothetical protein BN1708_017416, partial [Verticillium longisporum]